MEPIWPKLYPQLLDRAYLENAISRGLSQRALAEELGCSKQTIARAYAHHGLRGLSPGSRPSAKVHNPVLKKALDKIGN